MKRLLVATAAIAWTVCCGGHSPVAPTQEPNAQPQAPQSPAPSVVHLTGTVRDYGGLPLAGAQVTVSKGDGSQPQATPSDGAGHYAFEVPQGPLTLTAQFARLSNDTRRITLTGDLVQDLELMPVIGLKAGASVEAELHVGPHNYDCSVFLEPYDSLQPCRAFNIAVPGSGMLNARLQWSGGSGLALTQIVRAVFEFPGYGPTACCEPGETLAIKVDGTQVRLLVRLRDRRIAPVTFTLSTWVS